MDLLNPPQLDKKAIKKFFNRSAKSYDNAAILQQEVLTRLLERLEYMRHRPETIVDIGCGTGKGVRELQRTYSRARVYSVDMAIEMLAQASKRYRLLSTRRLVAADMERLPFANDSFDLVFSSLALQWCNDLPSTMRELARVSRPGALLLFASFGPSTLQELAASWQMIDASPHVHRFVDMHDVGDMMMAAGFKQPVVDAEVIRMEYGSFKHLLEDLKNIGASNSSIGRRRGLMTPSRLRQLEQCYRQHGFENDQYVASYEVTYGHAWMDQ